MKLPILVSLPHAGLRVPPEARPYCRLSFDDIVADGDEGAAEIYAVEEDVAQFVTTDIARAIVDLNRAEDDFRTDGVIKTHTCWNVPVYEPFPPQRIIGELLDRYYRPYHQTLSAPHSAVRLCVDCHTMAATAPPIGPDAGTPRPYVCLGDVDGTTLPHEWMNVLAECFAQSFGVDVSINQPFRGGHITRCHGGERPWVQVELSRAPFLTTDSKRSRLLLALREFCRKLV